MVFTMVFTTACDPMEDVYEELGNPESIITGEVAFELSDEDYDELDLSYGNFGSVDDAKSMIPNLLKDKYPVWGDGSLAAVTFKWYNKKNTYSKNVYALSEDEHNAITGKTYGTFDKDYHITNYLEATYPDAEEGDFHSLKYKFYAGSTTTLTDGFYFDNGEWNRISGFTPDEYKTMGNSYPNFSGHDEAEAKIPIALVDKYKFAAKEAGDIVGAMYEIYKGGGVTKSYTSNFIFNGSSWSKYNNVANETIKFGHDGSTWVPDNTIKLTFTSGDVAFISDALIGTYPGPADNVGYFGSFDRRSSSDNYWNDDMLLEAFNLLLDNKNPSAEEEQKYVLTFIIYNGATTTETNKVIKTGGVWVYQ